MSAGGDEMVYQIKKLRFQDGVTDEVNGEIIEVLAQHNATPGSNAVWYLTVLVRMA
jgi:hypothetical protein